jgi:hypothetical protein
VARDGVAIFQKSVLGRHARAGEILALLRPAGASDGRVPTP